MACGFNWESSGLHRTQFHALANLLSLRNQGQVEEASFLGDISEDDQQDEDDASSVDTACNDRLAGSDYPRLKKKFLDCLAEFAANQKGGLCVACTAMREAEEEVTIWISRNGGFLLKEKLFFERNLSQKLSMLSSDQDGTDIDDELWKEMIEYQRSRIEKDYISDLRLSFKRYEENIKLDQSPLQAILSPLRNFIFEKPTTPQGDVDRYSRLITQAHELRSSATLEKLLFTSLQATTRTKKIWTEICLIGRLRVAFLKFKEIRRKVSSFGRVTVVCLDKFPAPNNPPRNSLSLKQTFDLLGFDLNPDSMKAILGSKYGIPKAEQEFADMQKKKLNIHCEAQMLLFLSRDEALIDSVMPYFGCSKLSCFMCGHLLRAHGAFETRGCTGRLFKPWTVPDTKELGPSRAEQISSALIQVQKDLKKELKSSVKKKIALVKTSVVGGSSIMSENGWVASSVIQKHHLSMEQERITGNLRRSFLEHSSISTPIPTRDSAREPDDEADYEHECSGCERMTSRRCSFCNRGYYCSESCENKSSVNHLFSCRGRSLTTADFLYQSVVFDDILPEDEDTLAHFGFNNLPSEADKCKLLGLYRGVFYLDVEAEDINQWRLDGNLIENIKRVFYQLPENSRGGYFPWFMKNTHILQKATDNEEATNELVKTMINAARPYLDVEDQTKDIRDLKPPAKSQCALLLGQALNMIHPHPMEANWYDFGFCTCKNGREESQLGVLYQKLLTGKTLFEDVGHDNSFCYLYKPPQKTATFTEFWQAFDRGTLIQLMDSKGFKIKRTEFQFLEGFLSGTSQPPSVWALKQFVAVGEPAEFPLPGPVRVDYGFVNCGSFEDVVILLEIYRRLIEVADPLELHEACLAGDLFVFAKKFHYMEEEHRRLMKNFYPLKLN